MTTAEEIAAIFNAERGGGAPSCKCHAQREAYENLKKGLKSSAIKHLSEMMFKRNLHMIVIEAAWGVNFRKLLLDAYEEAIRELRDTTQSTTSEEIRHGVSKQGVHSGESGQGSGDEDDTVGATGGNTEHRDV